MKLGPVGKEITFLKDIEIVFEKEDGMDAWKPRKKQVSPAPFSSAATYTALLPAEASG